MRSPVLQLLLAGLAAVNKVNALPQETPEGDATQDTSPLGTPATVFSDSFQDLNILKDPIDISLDEASVTLSCIDCKAMADIVVNLTAEEGVNITDSLVNVAFYNTEAHIELSLVAQGSGETFIPIWSPGPSSSNGARFELGIALGIDADIDVRAGFEVMIPSGTYFNYVPSSGLQDTNLVLTDDIFRIIPLHVESGSATFKAALQARFSLGTDIDTALIDAQAEIGAYVNLPEIVWNVYGTETCGLEVTSFANVGFGLWASGGLSVGWEDDEDDEALEEDDGKTFSATPFTLGGTATDCLVDQPTSFRVGGAPPPTSEPLVVPTGFRVSGAPPPIALSATTTSAKPSVTVSGTFETGFAEVSLSASDDGPLTSSGSLVITAPANQYTTSTVYTTMVHTAVNCAASVAKCPAKSVHTVVVTDVVELYTTVCPVADAEAVPTLIASVPLSAEVSDKIEAPAISASQPPVLGGYGLNYDGSEKSNATETTSTHSSYQTPHGPSAVPVIAGAPGSKDVSKFGSLLAIAVCLMAL